MVNHIHEQMTLEDGRKYVVVKQAVYKNDNYYVCARLTDDGENIKDEYKVFHELLEENTVRMEEVSDSSIFKLIVSSVGL